MTSNSTLQNAITPQLKLANGETWGIVGDDDESRETVATMAKAMSLTAGGKPDHLLRVSSGNRHQLDCSRAPDEFRAAVLPNMGQKEVEPVRMVQAGTALAMSIQTTGGLLVHGAFAERDGEGVIFAGPGDVGKSTTSERLPPPWRALGDDACLVVPADDGYAVHPWPTWSRFMFNGDGGVWNVAEAVPLAAIYFLNQADHDEAEPVGEGEAICMMAKVTEQLAMSTLFFQDPDTQRQLRLAGFNTSCAIVKTVPSYILHQTIDGEFWNEIVL